MSFLFKVNNSHWSVSVDKVALETPWGVHSVPRLLFLIQKKPDLSVHAILMIALRWAQFEKGYNSLPRHSLFLSIELARNIHHGLTFLCQRIPTFTPGSTTVATMPTGQVQKRVRLLFSVMVRSLQPNIVPIGAPLTFSIRLMSSAILQGLTMIHFSIDALATSLLSVTWLTCIYKW